MGEIMRGEGCKSDEVYSWMISNSDLQRCQWNILSAGPVPLVSCEYYKYVNIVKPGTGAFPLVHGLTRLWLKGEELSVHMNMASCQRAEYTVNLCKSLPALASTEKLRYRTQKTKEIQRFVQSKEEQRKIRKHFPIPYQFLKVCVGVCVPFFQYFNDR